MENEETLQHFEKTIDLYRRLFRIEPEVMACDLHPEYLPTKYAHQLVAGGERPAPGAGAAPSRSHRQLPGGERPAWTPVIGVAFDGTGYGSDGTIWGGEFLVADLAGFRRVAHLEHVPMPGGAAAIRKPYRMALGYLLALLGWDFSLHELRLFGHTRPRGAGDSRAADGAPGQLAADVQRRTPVRRRLSPGRGEGRGGLRGPGGHRAGDAGRQECEGVPGLSLSACRKRTAAGWSGWGTWWRRWSMT